MKSLCIILGSLILAILSVGGASGQYYYSNNMQIPLYIDSSKVMVLFSDDAVLDSIVSFQYSYERIDSLIRGIKAPEGFDLYALNDGNNLAEFIDTLASRPDVDMANYYYLDSMGHFCLVGNTICCAFNDDVPYSIIDSLNVVYHLEIVRENESAPREFLLRLTEAATQSTLDIANIYYELPETKFAHPNFLADIILDGGGVYDCYSDLQWAMNRVFGINSTNRNARAFQLTSGVPEIIMAILDDGLAGHEDITQGRVLDYAAWDFSCYDRIPFPCDATGEGYHGMACTGIAAADKSSDSLDLNNPNSGVYGAAPGVSIIPYKMASAYEQGDTWNCCGDPNVYYVGMAIDEARLNGADIISGSWHYIYPVDIILYAVTRAAVAGRDGKGCGLFFSVGNAGTNMPWWPAAMDAVIAVGAIDKDDKIWDYSNYGKVDVVAPGGGPEPHVDKIWSIDQMGEKGGNFTGDAYDCGHSGEDDIDYLCSFGGTSSAQPIAAGIGALLLSRRPDLTRWQLHNIIRQSADPNLYETISNPPHEKYGWGMVHPYRALLSISRGDVNADGTLDILD